MTPNELQNFLTLSYGELEDLNLAAKAQRQGRVPMHQIQEERLKYLTDEKRIKAVTVLFSDLEGRLHMLDYDKKFLVKSWDNLTFDGSSIRGFTAQRESDLRLHMDCYADLKQASADRCPRLLGTFVKAPEVQYHHEVYNQFLWNMF
jgi:glutamine synthetase